MKKILFVVTLLQLLPSCDEKQRKEKEHAADTTISQFKTENKEELARYKLAVSTAIWGIPIVSTYSIRQAAFRDAGAKYGDMVYWSQQLDWKAQVPTPAVSTRIAFCLFNLKDGPMVIEIPPADGAGIFGSIVDVWQVPQADVGPAGEDVGKGGKYLLIPPGYKGEIPLRYLPVRFPTLNGFLIIRVIPDDFSTEAGQRAISIIKKTRLYPLSQVSNPPGMKYIDMSGKLFDGIVRFDAGLYHDLSSMLNEEFIQPRDSAMIASITKLGMRRGRNFAPKNDNENLMLTNAAREARSRLMKRAANEGPLFYLDRHWRQPTALGAQTRYTFMIDGQLDMGARGVAYFVLFGPPRRLGRASAYLVAYQDADEGQLMGQHVYHLHIPPKVPAEQFWAATVYSLETSTFFRNAPVINLDSYSQSMKRNDDGSVDIWFGPNVPQDKKNNWIYTMPGKPWYLVMRFYGPMKALEERTWILNDVEKIE